MQQQTKLYKLSDINAKNVIAAPMTPKTFIESKVQSKQNYHHNMAFPCSDKEKGGFDLQFPVLLTSSINEITNNGSKSYHFFADVYGTYHKFYEVVRNDVDRMLEATTEMTTPEEFKTLYMSELKKRGKKVEVLEKEYKTVIEDPCCDMNAEMFRYLVTGLLIQDQLVKDREGTELAESMKRLKQCYCDSLDAQKETKKKIYNGIGIIKEFPNPTAKMVDDIVQWQKYATEHQTMAKLNDYSKSPQIHFKILESVPKEDKKGVIVLADYGINKQVLWTTIYNYISDPFRETPINSLEEFEELVYRKGESKSGGKPAFKLLMSIKVVAPSVYWGEGPGKGTIQFKATVLKVSKMIQLRGGARLISPEERDRDHQEAREAMARFELANFDVAGYDHDNHEEHQPQVAEQGATSSLKRSHGTEMDNNDDIDQLIEQDILEQQQQPQKPAAAHRHTKKQKRT